MSEAPTQRTPNHSFDVIQFRLHWGMDAGFMQATVCRGRIGTTGCFVDRQGEFLSSSCARAEFRKNLGRTVLLYVYTCTSRGTEVNTLGNVNLTTVSSRAINLVCTSSSFRWSSILNSAAIISFPAWIVITALGLLFYT